MDHDVVAEEVELEVPTVSVRHEYVYYCDRCGMIMIERNCKVICENCGGRFDCSDLTLHFD